MRNQCFAQAQTGSKKKHILYVVTENVKSVYIKNGVIKIAWKENSLLPNSLFQADSLLEGCCLLTELYFK